MKIIKKTTEPEVPELTITEAVDEIVKRIQALGIDVSDARQHSVESHLRRSIRFCGFRPRETAAKPASAEELALQLQQAVKLVNGEVPAEKHENLSLCLLTTLSNLEWEHIDNQTKKPLPAPELSELPPPHINQPSPATTHTNNDTEENKL
jgi:hypothetical protein